MVILQAKYPTTIEELAIYLAIGVLALLTWVLRKVLNSQTTLANNLTNHMNDDRETLKEISTHMGSTNEILRVLRDELFSAALRKPEK